MSVKIKVRGRVYECRPDTHVLCTETTSALQFKGVCLSTTDKSNIGKFRETWYGPNFILVKTDTFEFKQSTYKL